MLELLKKSILANITRHNLVDWTGVNLDLLSPIINPDKKQVRCTAESNGSGIIYFCGVRYHYWIKEQKEIEISKI